MEYVHFLIDFLLHIDVHLAQMVAQYGVWVYAILFAIIFARPGLVVTPFLPGDSLLFVGGALAALPTNELNVHLLVLAVAVAAVSGDAANYTIGVCSAKIVQESGFPDFQTELPGENARFL